MTSVSIFINLIRRFLIWKEISISVRLRSAFCISQMHVLVAFFFFFLTFWAKMFDFSLHDMHCSRIHKFYFSVTFSLKMDLTVLFIYLKIILLQSFQFLVFSFQFWSIFKRILNVTQRLKVAQSNTISRLDSAHQSIINYRI